jgi:hypothetical protein
MDINIWVPGYAHGVNEQVIANGSIYKCIKYHDSDYEPGVASGYEEYWEVITGGTTSSQEAEQNALTDMWDDTAKTLTLEGGTANPALVVSGGQAATYGAGTARKGRESPTANPVDANARRRKSVFSHPGTAATEALGCWGAEDS